MSSCWRTPGASVTFLENDFLLKTNALIDERLFEDAHHASHCSAVSIARHLCIAPSAKRARPLVCFYYHSLFSEQENEGIVPIGVAAEFIHAASLLHDDVIDEAERRRGKKSANAVFGNAQAVLAGNYLLTQAFDILRPFDRKLIDKAIEVVREMTIGAILEINNRGSLDVDRASWHRVVQGKTGILFAWCGWAAAFNQKRYEDTERLWALGFRIGTIFQLVDDLKDFNGDGNLKEIANDIRNKELSLPVILAIESSPAIKKDFEKKFAQEVLCDEDVNFLKNLVLQSQAIEESKSHIRHELLAIEDSLSKYEGTLGKKALDQWMSELARMPSIMC